VKLLDDASEISEYLKATLTAPLLAVKVTAAMEYIGSVKYEATAVFFWNVLGD
jgi:hypothetical protein